MIREKKICSICGKEYYSYGNNARPFEGRCCDECNYNFVIPLRARMLDFEIELSDEVKRKIIKLQLLIKEDNAAISCKEEMKRVNL